MQEQTEPLSSPTQHPDLNALVERIASAVVMADASDVVALAALHTDLQAARGTTGPVADCAGAAERLVEQLILREVTDTDATLKAMSAIVTEMVQLANSATCGDATSGGGTSTTVDLSPSAPAAAAHALDERPIAADDLPLVQEFIAEALGHLEAAETELLRLESAREADVESLNAIFRAFHTIKGVAGFLNLRQIGALAHSAESLLDLARKGELRLENVSLDLVLESVDVAKVLVISTDTAAKANTAVPAEPRVPSLIARLNACVEAKGAAPAAGAAVATPAPKAVAAPQHDAPVQPQATAAPVTVASPAIAAPARPIAAAPQPAARPEGAAPTTGSSAGDGTVKVATDRLDALINMVGELVIAQSMVAQDAKTVTTAAATNGQRLARNIGHLGKLTRELQDLSMSMRMVPIHGVFHKMSRLVRDLTRKSGKEIELNVVGGETELDRNVVEAISDPLIHMVRNAADHGVEMPDVREAAGKPRVGRIDLRAYQQAGKIFVEIGDNGRGLNKGKILKKALAAGIISENEELTDQQIFQLIFHAGLSTAEQITDVSGRGVGMDVVKRNVESLRGRIEITSVEGKGATFTIQLPLTLAVIDGLIVRVGAEQYIVPITSIEKSLRPTAAQLSSIQGRGEMCMVRDRLLPIFRLHQMFNVPNAKQDPTEALVVVVQDNDRCCCLLVDDLLGQQQVVIKSLGEGVGTTLGISGGAILGDGSVSMILDVPGLIDLAGGA